MKKGQDKDKEKEFMHREWVRNMLACFFYEEPNPIFLGLFGSFHGLIVYFSCSIIFFILHVLDYARAFAIPIYIKAEVCQTSYDNNRLNTCMTHKVNCLSRKS